MTTLAEESNIEIDMCEECGTEADDTDGPATIACNDCGTIVCELCSKYGLCTSCRRDAGDWS